MSSDVNRHIRDKLNTHEGGPRFIQIIVNSLIRRTVLAGIRRPPGSKQRRLDGVCVCVRESLSLSACVRVSVSSACASRAPPLGSRPALLHNIVTAGPQGTWLGEKQKNNARGSRLVVVVTAMRWPYEEGRGGGGGGGEDERTDCASGGRPMFIYVFVCVWRNPVVVNMT